jgi:hypothetical protein
MRSKQSACQLRRHWTRAGRDGLRSYSVMCDTNLQEIKPTMPEVGVSACYRVRGGLYAIDLVLVRPLAPGEVAAIEYSTRLSFPLQAPEPLFKHIATHRTNNVTVGITFDAGRLPSSVHWTVWRDHQMDAPIVIDEPVKLDSEHRARKYLTVVDRSAIGFRWSW